MVPFGILQVVRPLKIFWVSNYVIQVLPCLANDAMDTQRYRWLGRTLIRVVKMICCPLNQRLITPIQFIAFRIYQSIGVRRVTTEID